MLAPARSLRACMHRGTSSWIGLSPTPPWSLILPSISAEGGTVLLTAWVFLLFVVELQGTYAVALTEPADLQQLGDAT